MYEGLVSKTHYLQMIKRVEKIHKGARTKGTVSHIKKIDVKSFQ